MRVCSGAGCLRAVADDVRYCDACRPQPQHDTSGQREHTLADRDKYAFLYSSTRWQSLRTLVARAQPMCARCRTRLTAIVDHVVPAGVAIEQARESGKFTHKYAGFFLRSNLQGLCRECHFQKTIEDKAHTGAWPDVITQAEHKPKRVWTF